MNLTWLLFLTTALAATPTPTPTPPLPSSTTANANKWSSLQNAFHSLTANRTMPFPLPMATNGDLSNLENISPPPPSLLPQVFSAVPASILLDILDPSKRKSIASEVKTGSTPAWYQSLPTDVKNYMAAVNSQISEGALTATTGGSPTSTEASATESDMTENPTSNNGGGRGRVQPGMVEVLAVVGVGAMML